MSTESDKSDRNLYTQALTSEIRLLVRAISNDPSKRLQDLKLAYHFPGAQSLNELNSAQIINKISRINAKIEKRPSQPSTIEDIGFLQAVKDALIALTAPATGLTIAYTTLVVGGRRGTFTDSSFDLATKAYGRLRIRGIAHRYIAYGFTLIALLFTLFAGWEATKAALGKNLLQNLDLLRSQQAAIAGEKLRLETSLDRLPPTDQEIVELVQPQTDTIPLFLVPLCDRYRVTKATILRKMSAGGRLSDIRFETSPAERDVCGRDLVVSQNIKIAHHDLQVYAETWPHLVGGIFAMVGDLMGRTGLFPPGQPKLPCEQNQARDADEASRPDADTQQATKPVCDDVEFVVAPMLQVTANYVLPFTFGFIGSLLYVLLDHFTKVQKSTLNPRDLPLMVLRLSLGLVVAACVSLLFSSYASPGPSPSMPESATGTPPAGTLVASLTLSASGVTFLAGFGAEAVFTLLQDLITRVFTIPK